MTLLLVVDGLGHGPEAAAAAARATDIAERNAARRRPNMIDAVHMRAAAHARRRGRRGRSRSRARASCSSAASATSPASCRVGRQDRGIWSRTTARSATRCARFQEFSYPFPRGALLSALSDGLGLTLGARRLSRPRVAPSGARSPAFSIATIARGRDDITVVVLRNTAGEARARSDHVAIASRAAMSWPRASARARSRRLLGFDAQDQTRIATAVSEIARNAFRYAGGGTVEFALEGDRRRSSCSIAISDSGPGHRESRTTSSTARYRSQTGMGLGIVGRPPADGPVRHRVEPGDGTVVR